MPHSPTRNCCEFTFQTANPGYNSAISRREAPELCMTRCLENEGAGKAGCPPHPQPRVQSVESTRVSHHRFAGTPGLPCAMVLTVSFALSPVIGLCCHRRLADTSARLERQPPG